MIRTPAVAGTFYPAETAELTRTVEGLTRRGGPVVDALAIVVPHAGYVYSGAIAGEVFSRVRLPERFILLGPNHTGMGPRLSMTCSGEWLTPIGTASIDSDMAVRLLERDPELEDDIEAHRMEHAIEVEMPFLQFLAGDTMRFVPVTVGTANLDSLLRLGEAVAEVVSRSDETVLIVASSDMNHYESDEVTRVKDRRAIDRVLARDPRGLHEVVLNEDISMCGFAPTVAMLHASNLLGAGDAELLRYGTSGDVFGDRDRVVGYAGIAVRR